MAEWHHWLDGHEFEFEWTLGVSDGQGDLVCCDSWSRKESDMTERLNWTELEGLKWTEMFFCNSLAFSVIQWMLEIWSLVPLPFLNPAWTSVSSWLNYCWSLGWRILSISLLAWNECNCAIVWTFLGIALFGDSSENWPFPVLWPLMSFPNLLAYWV